MTRASFRQADVERAIRAVKARGVHSWRLRFPPEGGFEILPAAAEPEQPADEFEAWERSQGGERAA